MRKIIVSGILILLIVISVSAFTAYLVTRNQANVRFIVDPREDNQDHGYFEINGKRYYQLYTTTQVDIGDGLHYHRIDLRGSNK